MAPGPLGAEGQPRYLTPMSEGELQDGEMEERIRSALEERPEVLFAYLFGSRAGGRTHPESDVDVAVYLDPEASGEERDGDGAWSPGPWPEIHGAVVRAAWGGSRDRLERSGPSARRRDRGGAPEGADLLILNDAPPLISDRVARGGRLLFSRDEPARVRWIARTKSRYCDLRPLRERLDRAVSERIRSGRFGRRAGSGEGGSGGRA